MPPQEHRALCRSLPPETRHDQSSKSARRKPHLTDPISVRPWPCDGMTWSQYAESPDWSQARPCPKSETRETRGNAGNAGQPPLFRSSKRGKRGKRGETRKRGKRGGETRDSHHFSGAHEPHMLSLFRVPDSPGQSRGQSRDSHYFSGTVRRRSFQFSVLRAPRSDFRPLTLDFRLQPTQSWPLPPWTRPSPSPRLPSAVSRRPPRFNLRFDISTCRYFDFSAFRSVPPGALIHSAARGRDRAPIY